MRVIDDMDILLQIVLGRHFIEHGELPSTEPLCFSLSGSVFVPLGWLAQVFAALIDRIGGLYLLHTLRSVLYATALLLAATLSLTGQTRKPVGILLGIALAFPVFMTSANIRPQAAILPLFFLILHLANSSFLLWKKIIVTAAIGVLWQNLHASVPAGIAALVLLSVGNFLNGRWSPPTSPEAGPQAVPWSDAAILALILAGTQLCTPLGLDIFALSRLNYTISAQWLGISEWLPAWHSSMVMHLAPFWAALMLTLAVLWLRPTLRHPGEMALALPFAGLTLLSCRFVFFWAPLMVPIWARWADLLWEHRASSIPTSSESPSDSTTIPTVVVLLMILTGCLLPRYFSPLDRSSVPRQAVQQLVQQISFGRVYNFREWSGPLVYFSAGALKPAIDGRLYLFAYQTWLEYQQAASGEIAVASLTRKFAPDAFFLHPTYHAALTTLLRHDPAWRQIWADEQAVVFVPALSPPNPELRPSP